MCVCVSILAVVLGALTFVTPHHHSTCNATQHHREYLVAMLSCLAPVTPRICVLASQRIDAVSILLFRSVWLSDGSTQWRAENRRERNSTTMEKARAPYKIIWWRSMLVSAHLHRVYCKCVNGITPFLSNNNLALINSLSL